MTKNKPATHDTGELLALLYNVNLKGIVAFFDNMSEMERAEYYPSVRTWTDELVAAVKKVFAFEPENLKEIISGPFQRSWGYYARLISLPLFATTDVNPVKLYPLLLSYLFLDNPELESIVVSRKPEWLLETVEQFTGNSDDYQAIKIGWKIYRRFVRDGIMKATWTPFWFRVMFEAMENETVRPRNQEGTPLLQQFDEDPDLLEVVEPIL